MSRYNKLQNHVLKLQVKLASKSSSGTETSTKHLEKCGGRGRPGKNNSGSSPKKWQETSSVVLLII